MQAVVNFVTGMPDRIMHVMVFAAHNPGMVGAAAVTAAGIAISFYITARAWRREGR